MPLEIDQIIFSRYRIERLIRQGGLGNAYQARDQLLNRRVAIKEIHAPLLLDEAMLARLHEAAQPLVELHHPHLAAIYSVERDQHTLYVIAELIGGETLAERLLARKRFPPAQCAQIANELLSALAYLHASGVTHGALHPHNIWFLPDGTVKLAEPNLAALLGNSIRPTPDHSASPDDDFYISPEQAQGQRLDARSDLYSLGAILYLMLSGRTYFIPAGDRGANLYLILWAVPLPLPPGIPKAIAGFIDRALAKDRSARYSSAVEMAQALAAAATLPPSVLPAPGPLINLESALEPVLPAPPAVPPGVLPELAPAPIPPAPELVVETIPPAPPALQAEIEIEPVGEPFPPPPPAPEPIVFGEPQWVPLRSEVPAAETLEPKVDLATPTIVLEPVDQVAVEAGTDSPPGLPASVEIVAPPPAPAPRAVPPAPPTVLTRPVPAPIPAPKPRRSYGLIAALALGALVIVLVGGFALVNPGFIQNIVATRASEVILQGTATPLNENGATPITPVAIAAAATQTPTLLRTRTMTATPTENHTLTPTSTVTPVPPTSTPSPFPTQALSELKPFINEAQCKYGAEEDGLYHIRAGVGGLICGAVFPGSYSNMDLDARIRMIEGKGFGGGNLIIIFGYKSPEEYFGILLTRVGRMYGVARWQGDSPISIINYNPISERRQPDSKGITEDRIGIVVQNQTLTTYLNNVEVETVDLKDYGYTGGQVGFGVFSSDASVTTGTGSAVGDIVLTPL